MVITYRPASPYGDEITSTSKERDSETGLDYFGARYFSSAQGRFTALIRLAVNSLILNR
jgi:hypothetical protein